MRACLLGLALFALGGCQLNSFQSTLTGESTLPAGDAGTPLTAIPPFGSLSDIDFAKNDDFHTNDVLPSDLNSAKVTRLALSIVSPAGQDFSFLDEVRFYARTGDTSTLIAEKQDVSALQVEGDPPTLLLDVTGADLTPFINAGSVTFEAHGSGRAPSADTRLRATLDFELRVKVF